MPLTTAQPKSFTSAEPAPGLLLAEGAGTVLLIEDEPAISRMLVRLFAQAGLRVVAAADAAEGFAWLARDPGSVSLAFVDCHGADLDQRDFCRRVRSILPCLPVMVAAGPDLTGDRAEDNGLTVFVPRPYLPTELVWKVRSMLGRAAA